jgi:outer membrane protein assembly factor BamA
MPRRSSIVSLAAVVVAAACLGACSKQTRARKPGDEYLKKIDVQGNQEVKDKHLTSGLALQRAKKRKRPPDPYLVQLDRDRIRGEYLRRGYFGIDVRSRVERAGDSATVIYSVEEGQRATTRVAITGIPQDPDLTVAKIRAELPLEDGAPFDYAVYELAKPRLLGVAQDAGYAHARLDSTIYADQANRVAIVQLDYDLGPKCTFGEVEVTGVDGDLAEAVRARVQFSKGDVYSNQAISQTQRQLYAMARFSTVQVQPTEGETPVVGVKIAVAKAAPRELRLGGGFGIDPVALFEARARAGYTIAGWPFPLDTVTVDLRPAYAYQRDGSGWQPRIRALARLERQDLFWTYARGEVEGGYSYVAIEPYTSYGPRARVGFQTPVFTDRVQVGVGWSLESLEFDNLSPVFDMPKVAELGLDRTQRVGAYTQSLTIDLRDHPIEPTLGAYGSLRSAIGTRAAGGAFEFVQLVPELRGYVPIGPAVLGAKLRGGAFFGDVPATERFFSGGASNHRGFGERRLAPFQSGLVKGEPRVVPYGGVAMLETSLEARFPITTWREIGIGGAVFLDGGDVRDHLDELALGELYWAAGVGLRLQ